jgi:hypothetical protein
MRRHIKHVKLVFLVWITIFLALSLFVAFGVKGVAKNYLEQVLGKKVEFSGFRFSMPFAIEVDNFKAQNLCEIKKARLSLSFWQLFTGKVYFDRIELDYPVFYLERLHGNDLNISPIIARQMASSNASGEGSSNGKSANVEKKTNKQDFQPEIFFAIFSIKKGKLQLLDKTIRDEGFKVDIQDIDLQLTKFQNPPLKSEFDLSANVLGRSDQPVGEIKLTGFIDMVKKDMSADMNIKNLDGVFFQPYFQMFLPSDLESAKVNMNFNAEARNNKLYGKGNLVVENLALKNQDSTNKENLNGPLAGVIMSGMVNPAGRGEMEFDLLETSLDNPKWRIRPNIKIIQTTVQNFMSDPQGTIDKVKSIADIFKKKKD